MSTERPEYDPAELAKYDLTEDEAEDLRQGLLEIDRGETVPLAEAHAEIMAELEDELRLQEERERRAG
jgi:hypothetical protein